MTYEFGDIGSGDDEEEDDLELESDTDGSSEEEEVPRRGGSAAGATAPDMASQPVYGRVRMHSVAARAVEGAGTERRAALLEKGWARCTSVVVNGVAPSDYADFEAVDCDSFSGREWVLINTWSDEPLERRCGLSVVSRSHFRSR